MVGGMLIARDVMVEQRRACERWRNGPVGEVEDVEARVLNV